MLRENSTYEYPSFSGGLPSQTCTTACIGCMILHGDRERCYGAVALLWPGSDWIGQTHEKRHLKRAGEEGIALRARTNKMNERVAMELSEFTNLCDKILEENLLDNEKSIEQVYEDIKEICRDNVHQIRQEAFFIRKQLIIRNYCYGLKTTPYLQFLTVIIDSPRNNKITLNRQVIQQSEWKKILEIIYSVKNTSHYFDSNNNTLNSCKQEIKLGFSIKRLHDLNINIIFKDDNVYFSENSFNIIDNLLESHCKNIGGENILNFLFEKIRTNYDNKFSRFHVYREVTNGLAIVPQAVPWGYCIALGVKYLDYKGSITKENEFNNLLEILRDIIAVFEIQPESIWENIYVSSDKMIDFLQECVVYDNLISFFQINKNYCKQIINSLSARAMADNHKSFNVSMKNIIKVSYAIIDLSNNLIPTKVILKDIVNKCKLSKIQTLSVLEKILSPKNKKQNIKFHFPPSSEDIGHTSYPILRQGEFYILLPKSITSIAVLNSVLNQLSKPNGHFDNSMDSKLGRELEFFLRAEFSKRNIINHTGNFYFENKKIYGESDILIETNDIIFLFEIKKKSLTKKAMSGRDYSLLNDLSDSLLHSQDQAFKIEYLLKLTGEITLHDLDAGIKKTIFLSGRRIEKVSVSLHDFGSLQDHTTLETILKLSISSQVHSSDLEIDKRLKNWRDYTKDINNYLLLLKDTEIDRQRLFSNSSFMSVPQILTLLEYCNCEEDFASEYKKPRSISFSTRDFYKELSFRKTMSI
ncbi:hypothetical protein [Sodalis sp. RH16]|uniref:hypothetical protein n=1 Tax=Sodalis sp. RH16 TaxID=3394331 RepID=UPI0039B4A984